MADVGVSWYAGHVDSLGRTLLITGSGSLLAARVIDSRHRAAPVEEPDAEVNRVCGAELADSMLSEVTGGSLFSNHIAVVIDDVSSTPPDVVGTLMTLAKNPGGEPYPILSYEGGNKGRGLIDKLKKVRIETIAVAAPKSWDLPKLCMEEAWSRKVKLSQDAAGALVAAVGNDLRALTSAVVQPVSDAGGEPVDETLVWKYFAGRAEVTSFAVSDAVLAGDASLALERLRWALGSDVAPVLITSAMVSAFRGMGKCLETRGNGADLARRIGVPPFKLKEYQRTSRNWQPAGVVAAIGIVAWADADVKGTATNPDYAPERVVLGILRQKQTRNLAGLVFPV